MKYGELKWDGFSFWKISCFQFHYFRISVYTFCPTLWMIKLKSLSEKKNQIFCFLNSFVLRSERLPTVALQQSRWSSVSAAHFLAYYSGSNFYPKNKILLFKTNIFYESIFNFYFFHDCQQASSYQRMAVKNWSIWLMSQMSQFNYQDTHSS